MKIEATVGPQGSHVPCGGCGRVMFLPFDTSASCETMYLVEAQVWRLDGQHEDGEPPSRRVQHIGCSMQCISIMMLATMGEMDIASALRVVR